MGSTDTKFLYSLLTTEPTITRYALTIRRRAWKQPSFQTSAILGADATALVPQVANLLNEETPQIYAACGRGPRSSMRVLRPGLALTELAVWPLPGAPTAVWTLKRSQQDDLDAFIVVSFDNATLVRSSTSNSVGCQS